MRTVRAIVFGTSYIASMAACGGRLFDDASAPTDPVGAVNEAGADVFPVDSGSKDAQAESAARDASTAETSVPDAELPCGPSPGGVFNCCNGKACLGTCEPDGTCSCFGLKGGCGSLPGALCCPAPRSSCSALCR